MPLGREPRRRRSAGCWPKNGRWASTGPNITGRSAGGSIKLRAELKALLGKLKAQGCRIVAYGASAKESGLLNACGIGRDVIDFVVDRNAGKQGRYTPGAHLAVHSPDKLAEARPDYALLLDWSSADEILARHERYRNRAATSSFRFRSSAWPDVAPTGPAEPRWRQ